MKLYYTSQPYSLKNKIIYSIAIAVFCSLFFIPYQEIRIERIRAFGENKVVGTVIEKFDRKISKELSSRYLPGTQLILYRFTDPLGQAREQVASVSINKWESLSPGDNIVVYYAKSAPRISRIKGEEESSTVTILAKFSRPEI